METPPPSIPVAAPVTLACAGCRTALTLVGSQSLGDVGGAEATGIFALVHQACNRLDAYLCQRCGRLELFLEGIGQHVQNAPFAAEGEPAASPVTGGPRTVVSVLFQDAWRLDQQEQWESAIARYEEVMERFPGTTFARDADRRIAKIRLKLGI